MERHRDRFWVAGAKSDLRDAWVLATLLRTDRALFPITTVEQIMGQIDLLSLKPDEIETLHDLCLKVLRAGQRAVSLCPPFIPAYSISKAAAFNMTQSLRALLAGQGVAVHAVIIGPTDTDMTRGFDIPKASPESTAAGIFDGLEKGEQDIFPDPASRSAAEGWRTGVAKTLERQFAAFVPASAANLG